MGSGDRTRGQEAMERLSIRLSEIAKMQKRFTLQVLLGTAVWWILLFVWTQDFQRTNFVFTNTFQYLAVAWACWFMYPYFMRVEAKQDVALAMGHDSVDLMAKIDSSVERRLERVDQILDLIERSVNRVDKGDHTLIRVFREEMEALRREIRTGREEAERGIELALEEGEREAAKIAPRPSLPDIDPGSTKEIS